MFKNGNIITKVTFRKRTFVVAASKIKYSPDDMTTYGEESVSNYEIANEIYDGEPVNVFESLFSNYRILSLLNIGLKRRSWGSSYVEFKLMLSV